MYDRRCTPPFCYRVSIPVHPGCKLNLEALADAARLPLDPPAGFRVRDAADYVDYGPDVRVLTLYVTETPDMCKRVHDVWVKYLQGVSDPGIAQNGPKDAVQGDLSRVFLSVPCIAMLGLRPSFMIF